MQDKPCSDTKQGLSPMIMHRLALIGFTFNLQDNSCADIRASVDAHVTEMH